MQKKYIDLHCHSTASDGSCSPSEIVKIAAEKNLAAVALTDHDTVSGIKEFLNTAEKIPDFTAVPGVEVSVDMDGFEAHIVGLFVNYEHPQLNKLLKEIRFNRDNRNARIIEKLQSLGYDITLDEVLELAGGESVGRPIFAKILVQKAYFSERQEVFDNCLKRGQPGYCARILPKPEKAIQLIHDAGGIAIWAHPVHRRKTGRSYVLKTLTKLIELGLDGIETYYSTFSEYQHKLLRGIAEEFSLLESGGSDFHGTNQPGIELGTGYDKNTMHIPCSIYEKLLA